MTSPLVQHLLARRLKLDSRKHTQVLDEMNCDAGEIQLESTASMNDLMKALVDGGMSHLCPLLEDSCKKASCISQVQPVRGLICPESP